jgi:hypothetical protein
LLRRLLVSAALVGSALIVPAAAAQAATVQGVQGVQGRQGVQAHAACTYQRSGNHWNCVTPGAYCPKAAHNRYGYAKVTNRKYSCSQYDNGQWRWKRV